MNVGQVRAIPGQTVRHSPLFDHPDLPDNRAHSDVLGSRMQNPEVRVLFGRIATIVLRLEAED